MILASGELLPNPDADEISSPEVEFALVLSRIIGNAQEDPEELRRAIYDLARYKLQEQFEDGDDHDRVRTRRALEAAIQGVEAFSQKHETSHIKPVVHALAPYVSASNTGIPAAPEVEQHLQRRFGSRGNRRAPPGARPLLRKDYMRTSAVIAVVILVVGVALIQRNRLEALAILSANKPVTRAENATPAADAPQAAIVPPQIPAPDPLLPKSYGVYAISGGQLIELQPLPGRAPDLRVAISTAIQSKPQAVLAEGAPRFIVFRRETGATASEAPEVRIVARIGRDFSGEPTKFGEAGGSWVMRNITFPFRAGPVEGRPDMYEIRNSDDKRNLSPGRYALILRGQAYDFSVAGKPTDKRQCLERISSANGVFYSECNSP